MLISVENGIVSYLDKNENEQWRVNFSRFILFLKYRRTFTSVARMTESREFYKRFVL